jgi:hypothetical protein
MPAVSPTSPWPLETALPTWKHEGKSHGKWNLYQLLTYFSNILADERCINDMIGLETINTAPSSAVEKGRQTK